MPRTPDLAPLAPVAGSLWTTPDLTDTFHALCDFGGRLAGTPSELAARAYVDERLSEVGGTRKDFAFEYTGWQPGPASAVLEDRGASRALEAVALPGSPPLRDGTFEIVDLGSGASRDFDAAGDRPAGAAVVVRHEYPFTTGHTHRRAKYASARDAGAAAFLIANGVPLGGPVAGGTGTGRDDDIPALGLSGASGELLRAASPNARLRLSVSAQRTSWEARNLIVDLPGRTDEYVVLCAHLDGHNLAESAMDNATGIAAMIEVGRRLAPLVPSLRRGIRLAAFTVEEWGLTGSRRYVAALSPAERAQIACVVNLDSITGHPRLCALTGAHTGLESLVEQAVGATGVPVDVVRPPLSNSDHFSFHEVGIPAVRLIAGYGREDSATRHLLTPADRRNLVEPSELKAAATTAACLTYLACMAEDELVTHAN